MIYNVSRETFGGAIRMGDMIAAANIVEHLRKVGSAPQIKFHFTPGTINTTQYCHDFHDWLIANTDYFAVDSGHENLPWRRVNIWDYRDISGDLVQIKNTHETEKKIVVCPLFDAPYNTYRNWPETVFNSIIAQCNEKYAGLEKILCVGPNIQINNIPGWKISTDLNETLTHIMQSQVYIGGDTGLSHFAGALARGPEPIYWTSSRGLLHTTPINWYTNKKGTLRTYWLNFENTEW